MCHDAWSTFLMPHGQNDHRLLIAYMYCQVSFHGIHSGYHTVVAQRILAALRLRIIVFEQILISHRHPRNYFQLLSKLFCIHFTAKNDLFCIIFSPDIFLIVSLFLTKLPNIIKIFSLGQQEIFLV
jgi:hypothetical protein